MLSPQEIQEARAKLGIPAEGLRIGGGSSPTSPGGTDRITSFQQKVAQKRASLNPQPKAPQLGDGPAGEFGAGVVGSLIKTGSTIEKGLDQTLGRVGNAIAGKGFEPTHTGDDAEAFADRTINESGYSQAGNLVGMGAQLATPAGEGAAIVKGAGLLPKVGNFAAKVAPEFIKDTAIGTAETGDLGEGLGIGAGGAALKGVGVGAGKLLNKGTEDPIGYATKITMPKLTNKEAEQAIKTGRTTAPGIFKPSEVIPTSRDTLVGESVADVVSPRKSLPENVHAIEQKISQIDSGVRNMIADNKVPFNKAQLRKRLADSSEDSKLVFASEPTAQRTYDAVVDEFMKHVDQGDTLGLFDARQTFDKVPAIKKLLDSERLGENVRRQIVLDVRRAANEYVAEQLPANNPYRAALKSESRMIEALGNMAEQNASNIGLNKIQMLTKKYPILKWWLGIAGIGLIGAGGVGVGSTIVNSTD